jgi:hypothetical protein
VEKELMEWPAEARASAGFLFFGVRGGDLVNRDIRYQRSDIRRKEEEKKGLTTEDTERSRGHGELGGKGRGAKRDSSVRGVCLEGRVGGRVDVGGARGLAWSI